MTQKDYQSYIDQAFATSDPYECLAFLFLIQFSYIHPLERSLMQEELANLLQAVHTSQFQSNPD